MELQVTPTVIAYNSILSAAAKTGDLPACELFGSAATGKLRLIPRIWRNGQIDLGRNLVVAVRDLSLTR